MVMDKEILDSSATHNVNELSDSVPMSVVEPEVPTDVSSYSGAPTGTQQSPEQLSSETSIVTEEGVPPTASSDSTSSPELQQVGGGSVKNFLHSAKEKWNNVPQGWMQSRKDS